MRTNSHQQSGINKECKHIDKEVKHDRRNNKSVSTTAAAAADGPGGVCVLAHPSPPHAPPLPTTHALGGERPAWGQVVQRDRCVGEVETHMALPQVNMAVALFVNPPPYKLFPSLTLTLRFSKFLVFFSMRFITLWKGSRASWDPWFSGFTEAEGILYRATFVLIFLLRTALPAPPCCCCCCTPHTTLSTPRTHTITQRNNN